MVRIQRLVRNGNSTVFTVSAEMLLALKWHRGDEVLVELKDAHLVVRRWPTAETTHAVAAGTLGDRRRTRRR